MKKILPFFLLVLLLASCQKDPDMSKLSDDFVVFTNHDKDAKFDSYTKFYLPDSIMAIGNSESHQYWKAAESAEILSTIVANMEKCGYVWTDNKEEADLGLQVSYVESVNYFANYPSSPYWWDYSGYWWPGYWGPGWSGGWYYPYPVVYSYSVGSLLIDMVDLNAPAAKDSKLTVIWTAYMAGLLSGSNKINAQLAIRAIDQAFVQSPYIKK